MGVNHRNSNAGLHILCYQTSPSKLVQELCVHRPHKQAVLHTRIPQKVHGEIAGEVHFGTKNLGNCKQVIFKKLMENSFYEDAREDFKIFLYHNISHSMNTSKYTCTCSCRLFTKGDLNPGSSHGASRKRDSPISSRFLN